MYDRDEEANGIFLMESDFVIICVFVYCVMVASFLSPLGSIDLLELLSVGNMSAFRFRVDVELDG